MESLSNFIDGLNNRMEQIHNILAERIEALFEKSHGSISPSPSRLEKENGTRSQSFFVKRNDLFEDGTPNAKNDRNGQNISQNCQNTIDPS